MRAHAATEIAQLDRIIGEVKNIKDQQAALKEKLDILETAQGGPLRAGEAPRRARARSRRSGSWLTQARGEGAASLTFDGSARHHRRRLRLHDRAASRPRTSPAVELTKTSAAAQRRSGRHASTSTSRLTAPAPTTRPGAGRAAAPAQGGDGHGPAPRRASVEGARWPRRSAWWRPSWSLLTALNYFVVSASTFGASIQDTEQKIAARRAGAGAARQGAHREDRHRQQPEPVPAREGAARAAAAARRWPSCPRRRTSTSSSQLFQDRASKAGPRDLAASSRKAPATERLLRQDPHQR